MASIFDGLADLAGDAVGSVKRGAGVALNEVARVAKEHGVSADAVKAYGDQLVSENPAQAASFADAPLTSAVEGIAGSVPALGAHLAGAAAGARAGRAFGNPGAVAGGIIGGLVPDFVQAYGGNLERQDETGNHDAGSAAIAAAGQAALNQVNPIPAARALRIPGAPAALANVERPLLDAGAHALGFGVAGAATAPAQEALTRAAAGQSLSDPNALSAYQEAAIQGGIAGGVVGGVSRATENVLEQQRQRARDAEQRNADLKAKQQAEQQQGKPKKPEPEDVPFSPPDIAELTAPERARLDRAVNPAPLEVDPAKGAISKAAARGAADGAIEGATVKKPEPALPVLGEPAPDTPPVYQSDRFTGPDEQPLAIEGKKGLKADQREVEARSVQQVLADPEAALTGYAKLPDTDGGRIINADDARELFPDYSASAAGRTRHAASVQAAASWVADRAWERALQAEPRPGSTPDVVFMAGGSGAGKGTARKAPGAEEANKAFNAADIVFDGTFKDFNKSRNYIEQALSSGRTATIVYVSRDPVQAFMNGVLKRASREDYGRAVPIDVHVASHAGAAKTVAELAKMYAGDDRVNFHVIHNGEEVKLGTVDDLANRRQMGDNELIQEIGRGIEAERAKGAVPDRVYSYYRDALEEYRASEGARSGQGVEGARGADGREPAPQPEVARASAPPEATLDTVETGQPVSFDGMRNERFSRSDASPGAFEQGTEPFGRYMAHKAGALPAESSGQKWADIGRVSFKNPLVVPAEGWKKAVSEQFGGKTGKELSKALADAGHDGIITRDKYGVGEIVELPKREEIARASVDESKPYNGRGMAARSVSDLVSRQTKNWKSGPAVEVVPSSEFLPDEIRSVLPKTIDGAYNKGTIYLVADRLNSARDVRRVIAHEAYAHYGVRGVLGDKFDEFYQRVQSLKDTDEDIRRAYQSVNERYAGLEPNEIADEVVAHLAENYSTLKGRAKIVMAQIIAAFKRLMAKLNLKQDWSVNEVLDMIARSKRAIEQSPQQAERTAAAARASMEATPFFSAMVRSVVAAKGAPKSAAGGAWKQWLDGAQRRGEFRQGEREWSGIDAWLDSKHGNVSRDEIAEFMRNNSVRLEETQLGSANGKLPRGWFVEPDSNGEGRYEVRDENGIIRGEGDTEQDAIENAQDYDESNTSETKYGSYTLPGGKNYRELLLRLPIDREAYAKSLVDPVAWERMSPEQRAQFSSGHIRGDVETTYKSSHFDQPNIIAHVRMNDRTGPNGEKILHIEEIQSDWHQEGRKRGYKKSYALDRASKARMRYRDSVRRDAPEEEQDRLKKELDDAVAATNGVPDAPFKKEWPMLAFKRALREAVEGGYDKVTWTTGEQQAARYDLSKQVREISWARQKDGKYHIDVYPIQGEHISKRDLDSNGVADFVGKEIADKIEKNEGKFNDDRVAQFGITRGNLEGVDLKVGGEGMKAFYDKMLPSEVSKYVKQWGGKVDDYKLNTLNSAERSRMERLRDRGMLSDGLRKELDGLDVHSIDITTAMRDSVRQGQPMFSVPTPRASVPAQAESFDGWTRPSERLRDYITNSAKERIDAYRKVAGQRADQIRGVFQDYFTPVKRVQEAIKNRGGSIAEDADVYGREELYYGRTGERLRKLEDDHVKPLLQAMAKTGTNLDDLELYLYAKFAPERNARIAAINDRMPDGGSGMTNADAEKVLADFEANGQAKKLEALADRVYAMNEVRVAALEDAGLISKDEAKAWREDKHYVPLKGFAEDVPDDKVQRPPIGQGFSVGGKEAWRALGRRSRASDIIANIVSQTDQALIRAEKNRVAQSLLKLVQDNPNDRLWTTDKTVNKPGFDRATGEVKYANRPEPDAIIAKVDGEEHRINIYDPQLRDAIKNMGAAKVGAILRGFSSINRFLSLTRTTLAPEFALANMSRDLQEATVNLTGKLGPGAATRAVADVPAAIKAMWGQLGGKKVGGEWARWAQEFADAGGMTSFVAQRTVEEAQDRLRNLLKEANGGVVGNSRKLLTGTRDFIEQANNTIENATRLSAYVQGRRAGLSSVQAARLAKNLTVNFNRKGSAGTAINAMWLFYNASIQGSARFLHAIKSPRVQAMMGAIAATGFALSYYNRVIAGKDSDGEDLWDKVPDYEKQRNLIVMNAFGEGTHLKIPMPYTYNLPYLLGAEMADVVHGKKKSSTAAANMVNSVVGSFNPIGDYDIKKDPTEQTVKLFSPTALQPFLDLAFNRNHFDSPITPEESPFAKVKAPDSQRYFPSTNPGAVWLADQLNTLTGGNKVRPGAIDISPASMTYLWDYLTGGTGSFIDRTGTAAALALRGEDVPIGKVPFARVFAGSLDDRRVNDTFYQARDDVNAKAELGKLIAKPNGLPDASPSDHKDARFGLALASSLRNIERQLKPVNDAIKLARAKGDDERVKKLQEQQRTLMLQFNRAYFRVKEQMQD